jgi:hypothetical protein
MTHRTMKKKLERSGLKDELLQDSKALLIATIKKNKPGKTSEIMTRYSLVIYKASLNSTIDRKNYGEKLILW